MLLQLKTNLEGDVKYLSLTEVAGSLGAVTIQHQMCFQRLECFFN